MPCNKHTLQTLRATFPRFHVACRSLQLHRPAPDYVDESWHSTNLAAA